MALATGALVPLAETSLVRVWSFAHHRRVAGDPGHEVFPFGASQAAGAALAAVLVPLVGAVPLLALDALSYLAYAVCLARLPAGRPVAAAAALLAAPGLARAEVRPLDSPSR